LQPVAHPFSKNLRVVQTKSPLLVLCRKNGCSSFSWRDHPVRGLWEWCQAMPPDVHPQMLPKLQCEFHPDGNQSHWCGDSGWLSCIMNLAGKMRLAAQPVVDTSHGITAFQPFEERQIHIIALVSKHPCAAMKCGNHGKGPSPLLGDKYPVSVRLTCPRMRCPALPLDVAGIHGLRRGNRSSMRSIPFIQQPLRLFLLLCGFSDRHQRRLRSKEQSLSPLFAKNQGRWLIAWHCSIHR